MAKFRAKRTRKEPRLLRIERLMGIAAAFTDRTRVVENTVQPKDEVWRVRFNNGYTVIFRSDGTWDTA